MVPHAKMITPHPAGSCQRLRRAKYVDKPGRWSSFIAILLLTLGGTATMADVKADLFPDQPSVYLNPERTPGR